MIPREVIFGMEMQICILSYDSYTADSFASGMGVDSPRDRWQYAVDTIFRFYKCGIICANGDSADPDTLAAEWDDFILKLSKADPIDGDMKDYSFWKNWDLRLTSFGKDIVEGFGLRQDPFPLEEEFSKFMEKLFIEKGVEWTSGPLIKISSRRGE